MADKTPWDQVMRKIEDELESDTDAIALKLIGEEIDAGSHELTQNEFLGYIFRGWTQGIPERQMTPEQFRDRLLERYGAEQFIQIAALLWRPILKTWAQIAGGEYTLGEYGLPEIRPTALPTEVPNVPATA